MQRFNVGDEVLVVGPSSEWLDSRGTVLEVSRRASSADGRPIEEVAVNFSGQRRWFLAEHLAKAVNSRVFGTFSSMSWSGGRSMRTGRPV